ncbi:bacteriocin-like protein [Chryseobacterium daeguense]|uniref:bacteriocin-like protein n=1 Tax=Chryseobacterium daeguense TaxID=412438 RepID=UPI0009D6C445|nr:hypothetical protein [Chryseobacterium daeguense]
MKNLKKLSRNELKRISGGRKACSVVVKQPDGSFKTYPGTCSTTKPPNSAVLSDLVNWALTSPGYCETGLGNLTLTSNGGVSHCND